jgi:hypothetical protein
MTPLRRYYRLPLLLLLLMVDHLRSDCSQVIIGFCRFQKLTRVLAANQQSVAVNADDFDMRSYDSPVDKNCCWQTQTKEYLKFFARRHNTYKSNLNLALYKSSRELVSEVRVSKDNAR